MLVSRGRERGVSSLPLRSRPWGELVDVWDYLQHEKYLREKVVPVAVEAFHHLRKEQPDAELYEVAHAASTAALAAHGPILRVKDKEIGKRVIDAYMRMINAEFEVTIRELQQEVKRAASEAAKAQQVIN